MGTEVEEGKILVTEPFPSHTCLEVAGYGYLGLSSVPGCV